MNTWLDSEEIIIRAYTKEGILDKVKKFLSGKELYGEYWEAGELMKHTCKHPLNRPYYIKMTRLYRN